MNVKSIKKGFTLTELIIVIVIIGILAGVLIPTFINVVNKANRAADISLIRNLNEALTLDKYDKGEHKNMTQALEAAEEYGFNVAKISAKVSKNEILWDSKNDVFCYLNGTQIEYYPQSVASGSELPNNSYQLWVILPNVITDSKDLRSNYSTYLYGVDSIDTTAENPLIVDGRGLDTGECDVAFVKYVNTSTIAKNVVIRTNSASTILTVDAEKDTIAHYGEAGYLNIIKINTASYHEFGYVPQAQIAQGRIVNEAGSVETEDGSTKKAGVENLFIVAATEGEGSTAGTFSDVIVEAAQGAEVPALDRSDVNIVGSVLVVEVKTATTDDFVYLTKSGIVEQVVVTTEKNAESATAKAGSDATLNATASKAADEIANIAKRNAQGQVLAADGTTPIEDVSTISSVADITIAEPKATKADLEKSQGEDALFAGGAGTKNNPYLIATPEQFLKIESGTESNPKYYLMISDIDFDDATYTPKKLGADPFNAWCLLSNSLATQVKDIHFNGGGHDLSLSLNNCDVQGANRLCLFAYLGGTSVLENFNIVIDNYQTGEHCFFTLVDYSGDASEDHLTFKDITTKSNDPNVVISGSLYNNGIFTSQTFYGKVDFINCDNYVNLNGTNNKYYAPYIGGYIQSYSQVSFTDCDNYGNLSGVGSAAMFIGNNTNINKNSVTITNSYNYGTIRAASASGLFAQNIDSANAREIEELYLASCNRGIISVQSFNGFTYSIKENEINYNLTNTNNVGKIVLRINGHTSVLDNNNEYIGARGFQITQEISPVNSTNGTFTYKLGQVIRQLDYNLDIELSNSNKIYDDGEYVKVYYVEKDNQVYYVFDDGYGNYSVSPNLSIAITAYSTSGSILGNAVLEND